MENNELQHWGIKGQRWGHRRFQNKDGSLTPAGRKRYDDDDGDAPYKKQYEAARKEIAAERAAQRNAKAVGKYEAKTAKLEYKQAKQEAKAQEKAEKRKEIAKKVAIGAGIAAAAGLTYYGLKKYRDRQALGQDMANKMLDNMKDFTVDDVGSKAAKGRSKFGDVFSKVKTKLEDNVSTGPMKDDSDRPRPKTSKPDYDIEIQDAPKQSTPKTEKKRPADIFDVDFEDLSDKGKSIAAGRLNSPISGLLPAPKTSSTKAATNIDIDDAPANKSKAEKRIEKQASKLTDEQMRQSTKKIDDAISNLADKARKSEVARNAQVRNMEAARAYRKDVTDLWKQYYSANERQQAEIRKKIDHANRMAEQHDKWAEIYRNLG